MTEAELNGVACGFDSEGVSELPNFGKHIKVDNRSGDAARTCAFCASDNVSGGMGGYGRGLEYETILCHDCGGSTDLVRRDDDHAYF